MDTIRIAGVVRQSVVDGPGLRFVVFTQGCPHICPGCHNPETHDFDGGYDCGVDKILREIEKNPLLSGLTISGGEPFCRAAELLPLCRAARERGMNIICYTGYLFEDLLERSREDSDTDSLLRLTDTLVDGKYIQSLRDLTLRFRGSSNQRVIDVPASLSAGRAVEGGF